MKTIVSKFESYFLPAAGAARELLSVDPSVGLAASEVGLTSVGVLSGVVLTEERGLSRTVGRLLLLKRRDRLTLADKQCSPYCERSKINESYGLDCE